MHSPIVCEGDAVVTAPSDSRELIAVRLSDGTPLWRRQLDEARRLLGALGPSAEGGPNRLFVAGAEIQCLNADNGSILWTWPIPDPPAGGPSVHVTGTSILVASGKWLYILDPAGGELLRFQEVEGLDAGAVDAAFDRDCLALVSAEKVVALGGRVRAGELVEQAPPDAWTTAVRARLLRREGRQGDALARLAEAVALADKSPSGKSVARQLEREMVDLYHELHLAERKAGRNIEAFQWMAKALQAAGDTEYECKLGYRRDTGRDPSEPHVLRLTAGDLLSGKLVGLESGMVTFLVRGEAWQIAAPGVREIYLGSTARPAESIESGASHLLLRNGDRISCRVVCLRDDELTVRAAFGEFQAKLADISVIALGGAGIPAAGAVCVKLRNGDLLSGELIAFDGNEVVLGVPFCGKRRIPVAEIYAISNRRALPRQTLTGEEGAEGLDTLIRGPGDFGF